MPGSWHGGWLRQAVTVMGDVEMAIEDQFAEARRRLAGYLTENQTSLGDKPSRAESLANSQTNTATRRK